MLCVRCGDLIGTDGEGNLCRPCAEALEAGRQLEDDPPSPPAALRRGPGRPPKASAPAEAPGGPRPAEIRVGRFALVECAELPGRQGMAGDYIALVRAFLDSGMAICEVRGFHNKPDHTRDCCKQALAALGMDDVRCAVREKNRLFLIRGGEPAERGMS